MPPPRRRRLGQAARGDRERLPQVRLEIRIARAVRLGLAVRRDRPAVLPRPEVRVPQVVVHGSVAKPVGEQRFQEGRRLAVVRRGLRGIEDLERAEERSFARSRFRGEGPRQAGSGSVRSKHGTILCIAHEPRSRWRARLGMSPSAVSIIAGASDAIPDPYSADSIASSNRNTSARSAAGTAVWARVRVGFRRRQALGDDVPHVGDQPDQGRSNGPKCVHRSSRGKGFAGLGQLAFGRDGAPAVFAARPHRPTCGDEPRRRRSGSPPRTTAPPSARPARRRRRADRSAPRDRSRFEKSPVPAT